MRKLWWLALAAAIACNGEDDDTADTDEADADTDADTDSDSDADTDSDTDADTDSDTDTDTDTDTDADTDADDVTAPTLPSTVHPDYTVYWDGTSLNVYWRPASDDVTATDALAYQVWCEPHGGSATLAMDWTVGTAIAVESSSRYWFRACSGAPGDYDVWVIVADEAGNETDYPILTGTIPGSGDVTAPTLPSTVHPDYTVYYDKPSLNIYWRPAADNVTATDALVYQVWCQPNGGSPTLAMDWTVATALAVESSSRYWFPACSGGSGDYHAWVIVADEAGNETDYPILSGAIP